MTWPLSGGFVFSVFGLETARGVLRCPLIRGQWPVGEDLDVMVDLGVIDEEAEVPAEVDEGLALVGDPDMLMTERREGDLGELLTDARTAAWNRNR
jgi:hypothetical protein